MAKTIEEIQALIDAQNLDARQLINLIVDYLQANPPGGGGAIPTLTQILTENDSAGSNRITQVSNPEDDQDVSTKKYTDEKSYREVGSDLDVLIQKADQIIFINGWTAPRNITLPDSELSEKHVFTIVLRGFAATLIGTPIYSGDLEITELEAFYSYTIMCANGNYSLIHKTAQPHP